MPKDDLKMHPVISSNLAAAGYDEKKELLRLRFKNSTEYEYNGVPKWIYEGIFKAESPGKFIRDHVTHSKLYKAKKRP